MNDSFCVTAANGFSSIGPTLYGPVGTIDEARNWISLQLGGTQPEVVFPPNDSGGIFFGGVGWSTYAIIPCQSKALPLTNVPLQGTEITPIPVTNIPTIPPSDVISQPIEVYQPTEGVSQSSIPSTDTYIPLNDPTLQMAEDFYFELNCPDMNVDCVEGIDRLQTFLQNIFQKITDDLRDRVNQMEMTVANLLVDVSSRFASAISNLESFINNKYEQMIFEPETELITLEQKITQLLDKVGSNGEIKLSSPQEKTNVNVIENVFHDESITLSSATIGDTKEVAGEYEQILSMGNSQCHEKYFTTFLDLLGQLVIAVKQCCGQLKQPSTVIQNAEEVTCDMEHPNEVEYEMSVCFDQDESEYINRKNVTSLEQRYFTYNIGTLKEEQI